VSSPRRAIGFGDLVLFYIVTGISLRWIATAATAGASAITIWLIAWAAFFLPLALSVVELSSRYPQEGGLYLWSKRAFGDFAGFMTGWAYWTCNLPYYPAVLYFTASNALFLGGIRGGNLGADSRYFIGFSLASLLFAALISLIGLRVGRWLHNLGALGTWLPIALLLGMAGLALSRHGPATAFAGSELAPRTGLRDMVFWSTIVFALSGCEAASFMGDEIKNARRSIPRALLIGGTLVTTGYILGTVAVLVLVPAADVSGLQGIMQAISRGADRLGLQGITPIAALLITVSNLGAVGAWFAATARIPFVAGIDRFLPEAFGRIHPRWETPHVAIIVQAVLGALFVFLGQAGTGVQGAYDVLVSMGVITYFVPYLFLFAAVIRLQREPAGPGVMRIPGGRPAAIAVACVGLATTIATIALSLLPPPDEPNKVLAVVKIVGLSTGLMGAGVLVYALGRLRLARA
jgi:amino acid transporter